MPRLPPLRATSAAIARACVGSTCVGFTCVGFVGADLAWEETSIQLAARAVQIANGIEPGLMSAPPSALARVTAAVRRIEHDLAAELNLAELAREARLSPYHFLRTFQSLTGVTPHQFVLRRRLRQAAVRLGSERSKVLDIALDCGFRDLSNFNHAFRAEFGASPLGYRKLYLAIL